MMRPGLFLLLVVLLDASLCLCQPTDPPTPRRELRAAWIATVTNIDWPSRPGLPAAEQQRELVQLFDQMQRTNMNAVFVQVRPCGDAFFPSRWAPWSAYLTGTQGKDPGYDPLAFMISEAHRRNLQLHAWFNPYRVSLKDQLSDLAPNNPARLHPEWVVKYGGKLFYNPGLPQVKDLLVASIVEVVKNYEIDGVHFDDYFYPYPVPNQAFPDAAAFQQHGSGFSSVSDWRRDNVNRLVSEISARIKAINPDIQFGISPFGVWRNSAVDPTGSETTAGLTNYDDLYADTRTWIKNEWIDYIAPQLYWAIGFKPAPYEKLVPWWSREVAGTSVHLHIGQAAYRVTAWGNPEELPNQLILNRRYSAVKGSIFFSLKSLLANPLGFLDRLRSDFYKDPALPPEARPTPEP
ncbi:MAG: family 10 glycosylhydrolase [Candidatus Riflebacteria bacterium]|nr:family 10 glycosylhydrolase [Candidatus Riflebacteria bacterium]